VDVDVVGTVWVGRIVSDVVVVGGVDAGEVGKEGRKEERKEERKEGRIRRQNAWLGGKEIARHRKVGHGG